MSMLKTLLDEEYPNGTAECVGTITLGAGLNTIVRLTSRSDVGTAASYTRFELPGLQVMKLVSRRRQKGTSLTRALSLGCASHKV